MAITQEVLQKMKDALEGEKNRLEKELSRFAKPTGTKGEYETTFEDIGRDPDENALEVENYQGNLALEATFEKRLEAIQIALASLDAGTYGVCGSCGSEIETARLEANPAASTCISCARQNIE